MYIPKELLVTNTKGNKMSLSRFKSGKSNKNVKFMGEDVEIRKLSVNQVSRIQAAAEELKNSESDKDSLLLLCLVVKEGAAEFAEATDEDMFELPMDELSKLSDAILLHSGLGKQSAK